MRPKYSYQFSVQRHGFFDWRVHVVNLVSGWSGFIYIRHWSQVSALRASENLTQWYRNGVDEGTEAAQEKETGK